MIIEDIYRVTYDDQLICICVVDGDSRYTYYEGIVGNIPHELFKQGVHRLLSDYHPYTGSFLRVVILANSH